jgi:radical SAM protein with 4Fe4S-binding SPASM domain
MQFRRTIQEIASRFEKLKPDFDLNATGLFHYTHEGIGERSRLHLRIDPDQNAILMINANRIVHLNPTAAFMARLALERISHDQAIRAITRKFNVSNKEALSDYAQFANDFEQLTRSDSICPICDLDLQVSAPFSIQPAAPYRMDLALTYRCNNNCAHCYNARPRHFPELPTEAWYEILDNLWQIGIPHVVFTGGEPTLRNDLHLLISHAEKNGQITGLNTNARRLSDERFLSQLVEAGLDHIQITVESHNPSIHDQMVRAKGAWKQTIHGLRNVLETPLYVMTNTTMLRGNSPLLADTLEFLASLGVPTIGLNALIYSGNGLTVGTGLSEGELPSLLEVARRITDKNEQRLIWYTPTQYCNFDPMQLELGIKGCTAALYNMCIEPDGAVIPCQSYYQPVGNILCDPWNSIWNHDLSISLRERRYIQDECQDCVLLSECGGGCPLAIQANKQTVIPLNKIGIG